MNILWAQELPTSGGQPYLRRWVLDLGFGSLRLHHWLCSDDNRAPHDHPYWLWTLILKGGYTDWVYPSSREPSYSYREKRRPGSFRFWHAEHTHWVQVDESGCWSLCVTGKQSRIWGFWTERYDGVRRFVRSSRYFRKHGHHVCDN